MRLKRISWRRTAIWLLAPCAAALLLLILYCIKGIYPFGTLSISGGDLHRTYTADYLHVWDTVHSGGSLWYSFLTGTGLALTATLSTTSVFSPFTLLLLLLPRNLVIPSMSLLLVLKVSAMSLTAFWFCRKRFPQLPIFYGVFFSTAYALSNYVLIQHTNLIWLDTAVLLPLLLYTAEQALCGKKVLPFSLTLAAILIVNLYSGVMACVYTLLIAGAYLLLCLPPHKWPRAALSISAGALIGLLLSAWLTLPAARQLFSSGRGGALSLYSEEFMPYSGFSAEKALALYSLSFALVMLPPYFMRLWQRRAYKKVLFIAFFILIPIIPLFFRSIDNLWHLGGYYGYPYRYGFLSVFAVIAACAAAVEDRTLHVPEKPRSRCLACGVSLAAAAAALLFAVAAWKRADEVFPAAIAGRDGLQYFAVILAVVYALIYNIPRRLLSKILLYGTLSVQILCYGFGCIATDGIGVGETMLERASLMHPAFSSENDGLSRIRCDDDTFQQNYGFAAGYPTLASWIHFLPPALPDAMGSLGYLAYDTVLCDIGGTPFTHALLGVRRTVSSGLREQAVWQSADSSYSVSDNPWILPSAFTVDAAFAAIDPSAYSDCFDLQNDIYRALSGADEPLFTRIDLSAAKCGEDGIYRIRIPISGSGVLYAADSDRLSGGIVSLRAESLTKPSAAATAELKAEDATNTFDMGAYDAETVELSWSGDGSALCAAVMNPGALDTLCRAYASRGAAVRASGRTINVTASAEAEGMLLWLPVCAIDGWRCTVNGNAAALTPVIGAFIGVPLEAGENDVRLTFFPVGMRAGIVLTAVGLFLLAGLWRIERKHAALALAPVAAPVCYIMLAAVLLLWLGVFTAMYLYPMAYGFLLSFDYHTRW